MEENFYIDEIIFKFLRIILFSLFISELLSVIYIALKDDNFLSVCLFVSELAVTPESLLGYLKGGLLRKDCEGTQYPGQNLNENS